MLLKNKIISLFLLLYTGILAQNIYVPDDNFEQALIDLGYDNVLDDYVLSANITSVTNLNLQDKNIYDLTGIEGFTALDTLDCSNNHLTTLDISSNTNLTHLRCGFNSLTSLDLTNNPNLTKLFCYYNNLSEIIFHNNNSLIEIQASVNQLSAINTSEIPNIFLLWIDSNNLTAIDLSSNQNLQMLNIAHNQLRVLDTSNNPVLNGLDCQSNQIFELDLRQNPLNVLYCQNNNLTLLDIRNGYNDNMIDMYATGNPDLTCIFVDDVNLLEPSFWHIDSTSTFVTTQAECDALSVTNNYLTNINIVPNPVRDSFSINDNNIDKLILYSIQGIKILEYNGNKNNYNIGFIPKGIYYVKILKNNVATVKKMIKK